MAEGEDAAEMRNEEDVSPESWADSCIITSPDDSDDSNWGTFRDALTEIIHVHPEMFVPSPTTSVPSPDEDMTEAESVVMRNVEPEAASSSPSCDNFISSNEQVTEIVSLLTFESDPSKNSLQDPYFQLESTAVKGTTPRPVDHRKTDLEGVQCIEENGSVSKEDDAEDEPESETSNVFKDDFMSRYIQDSVDDVDDVPEDPTPQEIFKVWDLDVVGDDDDDEEDGLVLQLKNALHESSTVQPLDADQLVVDKSFIDDLIAGISDLSLTETSFK